MAWGVQVPLLCLAKALSLSPSGFLLGLPRSLPQTVTESSLEVSPGHSPAFMKMLSFTVYYILLHILSKEREVKDSHSRRVTEEQKLTSHRIPASMPITTETSPPLKSVGLLVKGPGPRSPSHFTPPSPPGPGLAEVTIQWSLRKLPTDCINSALPAEQFSSTFSSAGSKALLSGALKACKCVSLALGLRV